jgi:SprA-related family
MINGVAHLPAISSAKPSAHALAHALAYMQGVTKNAEISRDPIQAIRGVKALNKVDDQVTKRAQDDAQFSASALHAITQEEQQLQSRETRETSAPASAQGRSAAEQPELKNESQKEPNKTKPSTQQLTPEELRVVAQLQSRDREVRSHEAAHQAAGGGHVGAASYSYQRGPDGKNYAIGGEVPVSMSTSGSSPEDIIRQMEQISAAALAPANPSSQDYAVAAAADAMAAQARADLAEEKRTELAKQHNGGDKLSDSDASDKPDSENKSSEPSLSKAAEQHHALAAYQASMAASSNSGLNLFA